MTRVGVVPSLLRALLAVVGHDAGQLSGVRWWTVSGEELPARLAQDLRAVLPRAGLLNLYGSTEVAADATAGLGNCNLTVVKSPYARNKKGDNR